MHDRLTIPDYKLTQAQIDQYRRDGFIQLDDVITGDVLDTMRSVIEEAVDIETRESAGKAPEQTWLTGSPLGYRGPWGTTYATNLRPRFQSMTADQWVRFARNVQTRPPMPWFVLHEMSEADLRAMHAFVASLGPAAGTSPNYLPAGQEPAPPYVTFPTPPPR